MGRRRGRRGPRTLAPLLRDRLETAWHGGWARTVLLRRTAAGLLVLLAIALALSPQAGSSGVPAVVAARDLAPGVALDAAAVQVRSYPAAVVPDGVIGSIDEVAGRLLAAPLRRGEPVTDVRLTGAALARSVSADPDTVSVPVRLPDPDVAALLHPGATVDVVTLGERQDEPVVLARGARVLAVLPAGRGADGRLVLVALDPGAATRVAGASLSQAVTVTVR